MDVVWDCIIVGGGAAGLSARTGTRAGRGVARCSSTPVRRAIWRLTASEDCSVTTAVNPRELYETGRRELSAYPSVEVRTGEVVAGERG